MPTPDEPKYEAVCGCGKLISPELQAKIAKEFNQRWEGKIPLELHDYRAYGAQEERLRIQNWMIDHHDGIDRYVELWKMLHED